MSMPPSRLCGSRHPGPRGPKILLYLNGECAGFGLPFGWRNAFSAAAQIFAAHGGRQFDLFSARA